MTEADQFIAYQAIGDMFEAHSKPRPPNGVLKLFWSALCSFPIAEVSTAIEKAARELRWPARPAELREMIFVARGRGPSGPKVYRCHFHGDGKWFDGDGIERTDTPRPNLPSSNPTMWWCDRCTYFVRVGQQEKDWTPAERAATKARDVVRELANAKIVEDVGDAEEISFP